MPNARRPPSYPHVQPSGSSDTGTQTQPRRSAGCLPQNSLPRGDARSAVFSPGAGWQPQSAADQRQQRARFGNHPQVRAGTPADQLADERLEPPARRQPGLRPTAGSTSGVKCQELTPIPPIPPIPESPRRQQDRKQGQASNARAGRSVKVLHCSLLLLIK